MRKKARPSILELANHEGAAALLAATFSYLLRNDVPQKLILQAAREHCVGQMAHRKVSHYTKFVRAYEDMGMIMSAWFSLPRFLDREGRPVPLNAAHGPHSIPNLVRFSRVKISATDATEFMRRSPSVGIDAHGNYIALKRVFFLPNVEVPRAALVIERYLDTLLRNSSAHRKGTMPLLERNCHVSEIDLKSMTRILRDIKGRGRAFMDSVDADIEGYRTRKSRRKEVGELGVFVFAWTRKSKTK